jgi:nitroreductase
MRGTEMLQEHTHNEISKAIVRSQHTQRNFDLTKNIPEEDMKIMMNAVTECPSKQNIAYYKVHFIEDRDLIEDIHSHTRGFVTKKHESGYETNTQVLANLLVLFERHLPNDRLSDDSVKRNDQTRYFQEHGEWEDVVVRDMHTSVGIAAGYLNLTASLLGYRTGCCQCFDSDKVKEVALLEDAPLLLMGVGYHQKGINRRKHHIRDDFLFSAKKKMPIETKIWR